MHTSATKVFFSYARADGAFVLKLATDLRQAGIDLWLDQLDIPVGTPWDRAVEAALNACPGFLIVMTPASVASENVLDEAAYAIEHRKQIVPILLQPCQIPFRLSRLQYVDFTGDYQFALSRVIAVLNGEAGAKSPAPSRQSAAAKRGISTGAGLLAALLLVAVAGTGFWLLNDAAPVAETGQSPDVVAAAEADVVEGAPMQPMDIESRLLAANIILAEGDQAQVREWLASDLAYAALAESCLEVTEGQRVVFGAVPLDVINARYMESMGVSSDQHLQADQYGDLEKIRQAIFDTWLERYPNSGRRSFTDIVETR